MSFDYAKDNMERRPYEFYIEEYRQADPIEISNRLGLAFQVQKFTFSIFFMGVIALLFILQIFGMGEGIKNSH